MMGERIQAYFRESRTERFKAVESYWTAALDALLRT